MITHRRRFLGALLGVAAAPFIGKSVVVNWDWASRKAAAAQNVLTPANIQLVLTDHYNRFCKVVGKRPHRIVVSREVYNIYEASLQSAQRWYCGPSRTAGERYLAFKTTQMVVSESKQGLDFHMERINE